MTDTAQQQRRPHRTRGVYIPLDEVQICLLGGWSIIEDLATECLMLPPEDQQEEAA